MPHHGTVYSSKIANISLDIKPGVATKEEIFLKYGNAFTISDDEKVFTRKYVRTEESGLFVSSLCIGGCFAHDFTWGRITKEYEVEIEFDDNDVVKRCEELKLPRDKSQVNKSIENK